MSVAVPALDSPSAPAIRGRHLLLAVLVAFVCGAAAMGLFWAAWSTTSCGDVTSQVVQLEALGGVLDHHHYSLCQS